MRPDEHTVWCDGARWIGGPVFDLCFFFGAAPVSLLAGVLCLFVPSLIVPLWFAWLLLFDGPHLFATWQRTYLDAATRRSEAALLWTSLLWLLPGPVLLGVAWLTGTPDAFLLFLAVAAVWSFHHAVRQLHGILALYQRLGQAAADARKLDGRLLHGVLWCAFALFLLAHPANRAAIGFPAALEPFVPAGVGVLAAALLAASACWCAIVARRWRQGQAIKPGLFAIAVAAGTFLFAFFVIGLREPLLPQAVGPEQVFMVVTIVTGILHGTHYLAIVAVADSRRRTLAGSAASPFGTLARTYAVLVLLSAPYIGINLLRGVSPVASPVLPDSPTAQVFLALYWGLFFHHYWLDQKIWKPSSDARLRAELGLESA